MTALILASASRTRVALLRGAGLVFEAIAAPIDERAAEAPFLARGATPREVAVALADAKSLAVSGMRRDAIVVGADQTLDFGGRRWNKPVSIDAARAQIATLSGQSHALHSAVAVARGGRVAWRHVETARLTMRPLPAAAITAYLAEVGDAALASVGAYQIEGPGIRLFERIDGDHFAILGLPLLPLLVYLRGEGAISW